MRTGTINVLFFFRVLPVYLLNIGVHRLYMQPVVLGVKWYNKLEKLILNPSHQRIFRMQQKGEERATYPPYSSFHSLLQ